MKNFSRITFSLLLLGGLGSFPTIGLASETRVDATGGLTTILTDETSDLSLFLDGNPAGLVLLNTRSRIDLSEQWSYSDQEGSWGANKQQSFTSIPRTPDKAIQYEGLLLFPDPHWAIQVLGDFLSFQGIPAATYASDTYAQGQYRGLARAAYAFSFGAVGIEILNIQTDKNYDRGLYWPSADYPYVGITSGSSGQNQFLVKTGIVTTFPNPASSEAPRWQAGGYFTFQPGSSIQNQTLSLFYANSPPFPLNDTLTTTDYYNWGVELLYELPSVAKIRFSINRINFNSDFERMVAITSTFFKILNRYHLSQYSSMEANGSFRLSLPFTENESLKMGGSLDAFFNNTDLLQPTPVVYTLDNRQQINICFGIGLENPKEYAFGLQWKSQNDVGGSQNLQVNQSPNTSNPDFDLYQLVFGGEKWLSPTWAIRLGLVLEEDVYSGGTPNTLTTSVNTGVGLEQVFGRVDLRLWLGQATDNNYSANTVGLIGAQLSTTIFL